MAKALSHDLRIRVVNSYQAKEGSMAKIARKFAINIKTVHSWVNRFKSTGNLSPSKKGGNHKPIIANEQLPKLHALVSEKPDRTTLELAEEWSKRYNCQISRSSMDRALKRAKITSKKNFLRG